MKNFQTIIIFVFAALALLGVILFAIQKSNSGEAIPQISLWGTMDNNIFNKISNEIGSNKLAPFKISYKQFREDNFDSELIEALASGVGPDAIILSQDKILKYDGRPFTVEYILKKLSAIS